MTSNVEQAMRRVREIRAATQEKIGTSRQLCERSRALVQRNAVIREYVQQYVLASRMDRESRLDR